MFGMSISNIQNDSIPNTFYLYFRNKPYRTKIDREVTRIDLHVIITLVRFISHEYVLYKRFLMFKMLFS